MALNLYDKASHTVRYFLLHRLPTCKDTTAVISQSFERRLSLRERVTLKMHLWICIWCQWYFEHLQVMRQTIQAKAAETTESGAASEPRLSPEARERIKRRLNPGFRSGTAPPE